MILQSGSTVTTIKTQPKVRYKNLHRRFNAASQWCSQSSHLVGSPAHDSLDLFLKSCDASLMSEACSVLDFQQSEGNEVSGEKPCFWGKLTASAGLGHQMTEMLFFARLAHVYSLPHVFEPFSPVVSGHSSSYQWAGNFF